MKRALFAALLLVTSCKEWRDWVGRPIIWQFERRSAYAFPQDDEAAVRQLLTLTTRDGVHIKALWFPAPAGSAACRPALVYCRGQSGDLQDHYAQIKLIRDLGYDVLSFDYRGNGMSEGTTYDEEDTYLDAEAAAAELRARAPGQPIVYYGESLGGAVCTELAVRSRPVALHLDCTFASVDLLVRDGSQISMPSSFLTDVKYDTISKIRTLGLPLQLFHGTEDDLLRPAHSVALYDAAPEPKELWLIPGVDHGTDLLQTNPEYGAHLKPFLDATCPH